MKKRNQTLFILLCLATMVITSACSARSSGNTMAEGGTLEQSVAVEVEPVELGDLTVSNTLSAKVVYKTEADVTSEVAGEILDLHVKKGDAVTKGQVLAEVEVDVEEIEQTIAQEEITLKNANEVLKSANLSKEQTVQKLEQTKASLEKAGFSAESAKLASEQSELDRETELKNLQNQLNAAKKDLERIQNYFNEGIASQAELDDAKQVKEQAQLAYDQSLAKNDSSSISYKQAMIDVSSLEIDVASAEKDVEKAQTSVNQAKGNIEQAELNIQQAKDSLEDGNIYSPITGEITTVNFVEGQNISSQEALFTISSSNQVGVEAFVTPEYKKMLTMGKEVNVQDLSGEAKTNVIVTYVSSDTNDNGLYEIDFDFIDSQNTIPIGEAVQLVFTNTVEQDQLVVPTASILEDNGDTYVYIVEKGKAVKCKVEVINMQTESTAVKGDVKQGDSLVITGQKLLSDGMNVTLPGESSDATKNQGATSEKKGATTPENSAGSSSNQGGQQP